MTTVLSDDEITQRITALRADVEGEGDRHLSPAMASTGDNPALTVDPSPLYCKTLASHAETLIDSLHTDDGLCFGLAEIDILTRGCRAGELVLITGFAHAGKTQLVHTMILHNKDKRILYFSLDEPAAMVVAKLTAMHTGEAGETLEKRLSEADETARNTVRDVAQNVLTNLIVVDDVIGLEQMEVAIQEATGQWGAPPNAVIVDYDELVPIDNDGRSDDTTGRLKALLNQLKGKAKEAPFPWVVLHQGTRSNSRPGEPITLLSLGWTGEQQASMILGLRRKRDLKELSDADRIAHENTISVHVVKNKKPGGRCTALKGADFFMEPRNGVIRALTESERRRLFEPTSATAVASRASKQERWPLKDGF